MNALKWPALALLFSSVIATILLVSLGESPLVLWESIHQTLFTHFGLGYTLYYATPLIFTGLSVAMCFHCGLFNIGAEGQLYIGSVALVAFASAFPGLPPIIAIPMGIVVAALGGGLWGLLAGALKALRGTHEVIVTILLNFIAISMVEYLILYPLKNPLVQNAETVPLSENYHLSLLSTFSEGVGLDWFFSTPVNTSLFLSGIIAGAVWFFLTKTTWGYEIRASGYSPHAARFAGIRIAKNTMLAFFLSGALAGLVGVNEIMGHEHKLQQGFSPGYGFTGIAVALIGRNHPLGIILSGLLFGALQNGSRILEFQSERVSKELVLVLQALLIAFIAGQKLLQNRGRKRHA